MTNLFADMKDRKVILSTLWIFAILNYIYADIVTLMDSSVLEEMLTGSVGGLQITQGFLLGASILMESAIVMVVLSRVLKYRANRWANIIAGVIHTAAVFLSMFVGSTPALYYMFFGSIEMACTLFIVWYAWKWPDPEVSICEGKYFSSSTSHTRTKQRPWSFGVCGRDK